ncbi:Ribonuclease HI [Propionibacterium australiense]|uniref:Ribonuclease H n=1 Tax=Propionibacterium australiense TaxID=119981 RepID=A0A383S4D7_9ACTN|nr:ribonuclease H [Propionibacterium australiense]VEH91254.1 Ribonuclease HI [Propionibacterium australiense]
MIEAGGHNGCVIIAAADGSSLSNPGPAGWSWYIDDEHWASGGWPRGTNNMGELMAVLDLLRATAVDADQPLRILCDSQYVINSVTKWMPGWKRRGWRKKDGKPVLNVELLRAIDEALEGRDVSFEWVKGHAGHRMNEAADARARAAATAYQQHREPDPGPGYRPGAPGGGSGRAMAAASVLGAPDPVAAEPDLFSEPPRARDDLAEVWDAERSLLTASVRSDQDLLRVLLHPDFVEHDANGRIWTRSRLIAQIAPLERETRLEPLGATRLGPDAVLLRWRATTRTASSLRSSVWVRDDALGRPRWRLLFAQGTATRS